MGKTKYVADDYVQDIENYIYNDIPILKHPYYKNTGKNLKEDYIRSILKPGEKYVYLSDNLDHIVLTSFCRLINAETLHQLALRVYKQNTRMIIKGQKVDIYEIFDHNCWDYDFQKIREIYSKYGWKLSNVLPE